MRVKRWEFKPSPDEGKIKELNAKIRTSAITSALLLQRHIETYEEAKSFFRPSLQELHDPFLMKDMQKAVDRLCHAIDQNQSILIYGDYDVDGTTSVAMFYGFLKDRYERLSFYIPDRYKEGYGVSHQAIDQAMENGVDLIITLDCGIKAFEPIAKAQQNGIDVIVTDHHQPGEELPTAYAILNPAQKDCQYLYTKLSGCGVGFKLLQAFCKQKDIDEADLYSYLDFVAVSIAADIVPITGENRILTYHGLVQLNQQPRPAFRALLQLAQAKNTVDISQLVFIIAPRINAAGRIAHAHGAVKLLLAPSDHDATLLAKAVDENNTIRKDIDRSNTEEALAMIEASPTHNDAKTTVLFKEDWHKGVVGIVASRCIEQHYKPTIILTESNNKAVGSARSIKGYNIYEAIAQCQPLLEQFGGHAFAAGLTLKVKDVPAFQKKFEEVVSQNLKDDLLTPQQEIDLKIPLEAINTKMFEVIKQMAPFGPGNMKPVFASEHVIASRYTILKEKHLKLYLEIPHSVATIEAIGFNMAEYEAIVTGKAPFDIAYTIGENDFLGKKNLQLYIKDIRPIS